MVHGNHRAGIMPLMSSSTGNLARHLSAAGRVELLIWTRGISLS